jgi:hypothetical protein
VSGPADEQYKQLQSRRSTKTCRPSTEPSTSRAVWLTGVLLLLLLLPLLLLGPLLLGML